MNEVTTEPDGPPAPESGPGKGPGRDAGGEGARRGARQAEARRRRTARQARLRQVGEFVRHYSRIMILAALVLVFVLLFGFPRRHTSDDASPGLGAVPSYEVEYLDEHTIHVLTDVTKPEVVRLVFDQVRERQQDGDWWDVVVRCASIPEEAGDSRIATGRFANTTQGQAVTGLGQDEATFAMTGRTNCDPLPPDVPGAVSAADVDAAVERAGLRVISRRDGSAACAEIECLSRTVTDQYTVIVWPDTAAAERWAELATIDVWQLGPVTTVQVNEGGFDPNGPERAEYEAVFAQAAVDAGTPGPSPTTSRPGNAVGT
jgi:hypothetical protein